MQFDDKTRNRANQMLQAICEAVFEGKLCVTVGVDPKGNQVPYLAIMEVRDENRSVMAPIGPMLGDFQHGFKPGNESGEMAEVIEAKTEVVDDDGRTLKPKFADKGYQELLESLGRLMGDKAPAAAPRNAPEKDFDEQTQFIFNTICAAALKGRLGCLNATAKDGTKVPHLVVISEMNGVSATTMPVGPILGEYMKDTTTTDGRFDQMLVGPAANVPDHLKKHTLRADGSITHIDPKDIN